MSEETMLPVKARESGMSPGSYVINVQIGRSVYQITMSEHGVVESTTLIDSF